MESKCTTDGMGIKRWFLNGKLHRADGPVIIWANGIKSWYINGKRHREDGPAVELANGKDDCWWYNDICYLQNYKKMPLNLFLVYVKWKYKKNGT